MPSPFPGMNPYLEDPHVWSDFHNAFITYLREAISPMVSPRYYVQMEERVYLVDLEEDDHRPGGISDVNVTERPGTVSTGEGTAVVEVTAPARGLLPQYARESIRFLEVVDRDSSNVVTVIELLSPSNKATGDDRDSFMDKRRGLVTSRANYIELDLLRASRRLPLRRLPACEYYAMVSRPADRSNTDICPIRLRDPLPPIPIPLRAGETEPLLDLQAVLHHTYDAAGYAARIYRHAPQPSLPPEDAAWAEEIVRAATPTA